MNYEIKNHGLKIPDIVSREQGAGHILGSRLRGGVINPSGDWSAYLPENESQNIRNIETQACTVYATLNVIETLIFFKTGIKVNYSDRYLAIVGKVDPYSGADPHKIAECIRTIAGCLREHNLPWTDNIKTVEEYYGVPVDVITELMKEGRAWWDEWDLGHDWVFTSNFPQIEKKRLLGMALQRGTVAVSVYAWVEQNGIYVKPEGVRDGHYVQLVKIDNDGRFIIFDSYADGEGDPYLKTLSSDYNFEIAKVFYLTPAQVKISILAKILDLIGRILDITALQIKQLPVVPIDLPPPPPVETTATFTTETIEQMCVRVLKEEGMDEKQIKIAIAVIKAESGMNPKAVSEPNNNGTIDYGLCQFNNGKNKQGIPYWIGEGADFLSTDEVLNNPAKNVKVFAREYKKYGYPKWWSAYTNNSYRAYL